MTDFETIRSNTIPFEEGPLFWRFEETEDQIPYQAHEWQIEPLSKDGAKTLDRVLVNSGICSDFPMGKGFFKVIERLELTGTSHQDQLKDVDSSVKKWLYERGIPFEKEIYLNYGVDCGYITTWKMLVKYWRWFYYPISDDLFVVDDSLTWCLFFWHEHEIYFGNRKNRKVNNKGTFEP